MKIPEITINCFKVFGDPVMESIYDNQEKAVKTAWESVYNAVSSGCQVLAYWDSDPAIYPGYRSFLRYALHKSPRRDGWLQLSVMEIRNGDIIPTSHGDFNNLKDFLRRVMSYYGADVIFLGN